VAGFPADTIVLVARLAEHLQDLPDAPALADAMPFDDDEITNAPLQDTLRLRQRSPPSRFRTEPTLRGRRPPTRPPLTGLAGMRESRLTPGRRL